MSKAATAPASETDNWKYVDRLTDAIDDMTEELRVAREVMDEIREDLSWVTRNGIPGHRDGPTQIHRMARDPLATDANERLELRLNCGVTANSNSLSPEVFDELVSEITEVITVVGQEQLNMLLTALDTVRDKLLTAIKSSTSTPAISESKLKSAKRQHRSRYQTPPNRDSKPKPIPKSSDDGRLF